MNKYIVRKTTQGLANHIKTFRDDFKIAFTPLHGTGNIPARRVLKEIGFKYIGEKIREFEETGDRVSLFG